MEKTVKIIKQMQKQSLFSSYAIGGGIAALFYIEPVATYDLDIFIILPETDEILITLSPIYSWLKNHGYFPDKEQLIIEGVPVQFIPVYNDLVRESVLNAVEKKYGNTRLNVLRPEYLFAIMLQTFRSKDKERIIKFLDEASMDNHILTSILRKHHLMQRYSQYKNKFDEK